MNSLLKLIGLVGPLGMFMNSLSRLVDLVGPSRHVHEFPIEINRFRVSLSRVAYIPYWNQSVWLDPLSMFFDLLLKLPGLVGPSRDVRIFPIGISRFGYVFDLLLKSFALVRPDQHLD